MAKHNKFSLHLTVITTGTYISTRNVMKMQNQPSFAKRLCHHKTTLSLPHIQPIYVELSYKLRFKSACHRHKFCRRDFFPTFCNELLFNNLQTSKFYWISQNDKIVVVGSLNEFKVHTHSKMQHIVLQPLVWNATYYIATTGLKLRQVINYGVYEISVTIIYNVIINFHGALMLMTLRFRILWFLMKLPFLISK